VVAEVVFPVGGAAPNGEVELTPVSITKEPIVPAACSAELFQVEMLGVEAISDCVHVSNAASALPLELTVCVSEVSTPSVNVNCPRRGSASAVQNRKIKAISETFMRKRNQTNVTIL